MIPDERPDAVLERLAKSLCVAWLKAEGHPANWFAVEQLEAFWRMTSARTFFLRLADEVSASLLADLRRASRTRPDYALRCDACGAPHWLDTSIPSEVWNRIAPEVGLLCLLCIDERVAALGLTNVPAEFYFVGKGLLSRLYPGATREKVKEFLRRLLIGNVGATGSYDEAVDELFAILGCR